jgi:hypothetical protein
MMKKKTRKSDPADKKSAGGNKRTRRKKNLSSESVRDDISKLVKSHAEKMAEAVIEEGEKGQLAPVKYLFEMAHIFPPPADGSESTSEEDSLAKTLLDRLNVPDKPLVHDEEDDEIVVIPVKPAERSEVGEDEESAGRNDADKGSTTT